MRSRPARRFPGRDSPFIIERPNDPSNFGWLSRKRSVFERSPGNLGSNDKPMSHKFEWNSFADQPHNVAPRAERTRHHLRRWPTYLALLGSNLAWGPRVFWLYRRNRREMHRRLVNITPEMFGLAISPRFGRPGETEAAIALLHSSGVRQTLFRIPSWEKDRLAEYETFARHLRGEGFELTAALLQRRDDVFAPGAWMDFLLDVFARIGPSCSHFEIGHAWNRTKWGVWDHREYLTLARAAVAARDRIGRDRIKLVGPGVIDFEFHLYPPVLRAVDFDVVSSLLYVDRVGAPENAQYGFTTAKKIALFKAYADAASRRAVPAWITEVNWPLESTGPWSPASGKPNVSEEAQADYLVRYYVIALTSGLIDRVYWWQMVAPGYGLVDSRETPWRTRPSFTAFAFIAARLAGSAFVGKEEPTKPGGPGDGSDEVYHFRKDGREFALAWTTGAPRRRAFGRMIGEVLNRSGQVLPREREDGGVQIDGSPRYVIFE